MPAWMQVVERRLEQAAEEGGDTVVKGWQILSDGALVVVPVVIPAWREWLV